MKRFYIMPAIHTIVFAIANYVIEVKIQLLLQATVFTGPLLQVITFGISLFFLTQNVQQL